MITVTTLRQVQTVCVCVGGDMINKHVLFCFIHTFHSVLLSLKSKMLLQILMIVHFYIYLVIHIFSIGIS